MAAVEVASAMSGSEIVVRRKKWRPFVGHRDLIGLAEGSDILMRFRSAGWPLGSRGSERCLPPLVSDRRLLLLLLLLFSRCSMAHRRPPNHPAAESGPWTRCQITSCTKG